MIPVSMAAKPKGFDERVRKPGLRELNRQGRLNPGDIW